MDSSMVFATWRQCALHLIMLPWAHHSSPQSVPILYNGPLLPPSKLPFPMGVWTPSNTWFLGPTRVLNPNSISIGSAVLAGLTTVTDWPTDRKAAFTYVVLRCGLTTHIKDVGHIHRRNSTATILQYFSTQTQQQPRNYSLGCHGWLTRVLLD